MPVTNSRRIAEWQTRFNQIVREVLGPPLAERGYTVSLDEVTEEVEPDSYGPFYIGEIGWSRELPAKGYAHVVLQSTTQFSSERDVFYVDLIRNESATPPSYQYPESPGTSRQTRLTQAPGDRGAGAGASTQQGWAFHGAAELRDALERLRARLVEPAENAVPPLDALEHGAGAAPDHHE